VGVEPFIVIAAYTGLAMLVWDSIEVGRNDAANLVNAVFGARVMTRQVAAVVAGIAVVLGAVFASPVMETVRSGIFEPAALSVEAAIVVYISVYVVDTVLLYSLSAFGMPVSTTASLVFELVGAALGVTLVNHGWRAAIAVVHWDKVGQVVLAIIVSILLSGFAAYLIQRAVRGAIGPDPTARVKVQLHGPWIGGLMLTWLTWFMLLKGLRELATVDGIAYQTLEQFGVLPLLLMTWFGYAMAILALLLVWSGSAALLFRSLALLGMICMAFAFGQNDLANAASPGLSAWWLYRHAGDSTAVATALPISKWALLASGLLMAIGMTTRKAQRVTRAAVNTGSQHGDVALWAPMWSRAIARMIIGNRPGPAIAQASRDESGKRVHFDALRASVITSVSASVIAFASSRGLPVSTTYVAFAAVVATGWGDRVFQGGQADLKLGRAIWVATSWLVAAMVAMVATAAIAILIYQAMTLGLIAALSLNIAIRRYAHRAAERHEATYRRERELRLAEVADRVSLAS